MNMTKDQFEEAMANEELLVAEVNGKNLDAKAMYEQYGFSVKSIHMELLEK